MSKKTRDKRLSAYADGALPDGQRERLERELERDDALREALRRTQSLGRLVRESWTEGPPAPPVEFLLASVRPHIAAIDRERRAQPAWQRALERLRIELGRWLGPAPIAASAAAAFLLALVVLPNSTEPIPAMQGNGSTASAPHNTHSPLPPLPLPGARTPYAPAAATVYDMAPGERPAMIFEEKDGSTVLWLLDDDGTSWLQGLRDRWG